MDVSGLVTFLLTLVGVVLIALALKALWDARKGNMRNVAAVVGAAALGCVLLAFGVVDGAAQQFGTWALSLVGIG